MNELVEAFVKLQQEYEKCSLLLVGPFEDDLDPISEKINIAIINNPKIIATDYKKDVRIYYAISNTFVFPTYREGFPNVVLQAGAMELPSIVSNINGCNEIIEDGKNGILIPPKNMELLFNKMKLLMNDAVLLNNLSANSRELVKNRFERDFIWKSILDEYKILLENL